MAPPSSKGYPIDLILYPSGTLSAWDHYKKIEVNLRGTGMKCPKCNFVQSDRNLRCKKCGLKLDVELEQGVTPRRKADAPGGEEAGSIAVCDLFRDLFLSVDQEVNHFSFAGRVFIFTIFFVWGWIFILSPMASNGAGSSFLHLINLPFHEAGHIFFRIFGRWMMSLGGTLGQLLIPLICLTAFLVKTKDPFGAAVCLWWFGQNFIDVAPYINDARKGELMLLGGVTGQEADYGYHDWEFILNEIGLLHYDRVFARLAHGLGVVLMLISFVWAGYLLYRQYKNLART